MSIKRTFGIFSASCLFFIVLCVGCGKNVPLRGTVVFEDDDSPVTNGTICFTDGKNLSRGTIQPDGTFDMGSVGMKDGLPPGEYTVYFFDVSGPAPEASRQTMMSRPSLIDPKYNSPKTSDLKAVVDGATKTMEFRVDRNPKLK